MLLEKSKIQTAGNRKRKFSAISFQKSLTFRICVFFRKCAMFRWSIPLSQGKTLEQYLWNKVFKKVGRIYVYFNYSYFSDINIFSKIFVSEKHFWRNSSVTLRYLIIFHPNQGLGRGSRQKYKLKSIKRRGLE